MVFEFPRDNGLEWTSAFSGQGDLPPLAAGLLWKASRLDNPDDFLAASLPELLRGAMADYLVVVAARGGRWTVLAEAGHPRSLPVDLLAESLDAELARAADAWTVAPLHRHAPTAELLAAHQRQAKPQGEPSCRFVQSMAPILGQCLTAIRDRHAANARRDRRLDRLETIVRIARQWSRRHEVEPLLADMAEAATRLLDADRASIFLWDRSTKTLVGRPALGVEQGELRIPDDAGVVGQVIRTGKPRRADVEAESNLIDRQVDAALGYKTNSVLCVPLDALDGRRLGAFELLNKRSGAFTAEDEEALVELAAWAAIALENARDREYLLSTNRRISQQAADECRMIGESGPIRSLRSIVDRVADTDLAVLIQGENGTGKEVVARTIHYRSRRRDKPFVAVNCAAIPETLAESELFGHEKGAFTDARETRLGKFELAADGTLFLDEIGDLSLGSQGKLLRVLEEKLLVRVGGSVPIHTEARVLAATNQDLAEMVRLKKFRQDLYFRLNVVTLEVPPLRDRGDDIMLLAREFLADFCRKARRQMPRFSPAAERRLRDHAWPGNVRELRNLMERLAYLSSEDRIEVEDLAFILSPGRAAGDLGLLAGGDRSLTQATGEFQVEFIRRAIERAGGNVSRAAGRLGLHRSNLYRKMRQLGMETELEE